MSWRSLRTSARGTTVVRSAEGPPGDGGVRHRAAAGLREGGGGGGWRQHEKTTGLSYQIWCAGVLWLWDGSEVKKRRNGKP